MILNSLPSENPCVFSMEVLQTSSGILYGASSPSCFARNDLASLGRTDSSEVCSMLKKSGPHLLVHAFSCCSAFWSSPWAQNLQHFTLWLHCWASFLHPNLRGKRLKKEEQQLACVVSEVIQLYYRVYRSPRVLLTFCFQSGNGYVRHFHLHHMMQYPSAFLYLRNNLNGAPSVLWFKLVLWRREPW